MSQETNPLSLLDPEVLNRSPAIEELIQQFATKLPPHFGKPYLIPPPPQSNLKPVLRSNYSNPNCSVRAITHVTRDKNQKLQIDKEPLFDRTGKACDACKTFLGLK